MNIPKDGCRLFTPAFIPCLLLLLPVLVGLSGQALADGGSCPIDSAGSSACGAPRAGSYSPSDESARFVGNPVDVVTGTKAEQRTDWRAFGSRLGFSRQYSSKDAEANTGVGSGWRHEYDLSLARISGTDALRIKQSNGVDVDFYTDANTPAQWHSIHLEFGSITLADGRYVWMVPDGRRIYFPGARPDRIEWPDGDVLALRWEAGRLVQVQDRHNRSIKLHWTPGTIPLLRSYEPTEDTTIPGHLESIELPDGTSLSYRYDNLYRTRALNLDDTPLEAYDYDDRHLYSLSGITDSEGTRQWRYLDDGRVGQFIERDGRSLSFTYRDLSYSDVGESGTTEVRRQDGMTVTYDWRVDTEQNAVLDRVVEYPCEGCIGEPRDITPEPVDTRGLASDESIAGTTEPVFEPVEGIHVERIGDTDADILVDALGERYTVQFDRYGQAIEIRSLDGDNARPRTPDEIIELSRVSNYLTPGATVDLRGGLFQNQPTTNICPLPVTRTCDELQHDLQLANISLCAYAVGPCNVPGWEQVSAEDLGVPASSLDNGNFHAVAYRDENTGEIVVGFRGTESLQDLWDDLLQFEGHPSEVYQSAVELGRDLDLIGVEVTYTGHSLGGGLATAAALAGDEQAIGFNSAALTEESAALYNLDLDDANSHVTHLLVPGEFVTAMQERPIRDPNGSGPHNDYGPNRLPWETHPAPGQRDVLEPPDAEQLAQTADSLPWLAAALASRDTELAVASHLMVSVISSIHQTIAARCP